MEYISKKAMSFKQFITGKEPKDSETEEHKGNNFVQNEISDQETYYEVEFYETEEHKTRDPLSTMISNDPPSTVTKSRNEEVLKINNAQSMKSAVESEEQTVDEVSMNFNELRLCDKPKKDKGKERFGNHAVQDEKSEEELKDFEEKKLKKEMKKEKSIMELRMGLEMQRSLAEEIPYIDDSKETSSTDNNSQKNSCASDSSQKNSCASDSSQKNSCAGDSLQKNSCAGESSERCSSADCEQIYTTLPVALNPHDIDYIKMDPGPPNLCTDAGKSLAKEINLSDVSSNADTTDQNFEQRYPTLPVVLNPPDIDYIKMDPGPPNLCTDAGKSSAKEINLSDVSSNANTKDQSNMGNNQKLANEKKLADEIKLADGKCFSIIDNLSDAEKESFDMKTMKPIKFFSRGLPHLARSLDQSDFLDVVVNYFNLEENDRKKILFANYGGGNPGKSLFDHLEQSNPRLKIEELRECFETYSLTSALSFLKDCKYSDKTKVSDISYSHKNTLSYKLFSFNANEKPWKDVANRLGCLREDVDRIAKTMMHPNRYSPTEKLIDILSMQTETTIQDFMDALKSCKMNDAYKVMYQQIIKEIKDSSRK